MTDTDGAADPGWAQEGCRFIGMRSAQVAEYELTGRELRLAPATRAHRVVVRVPMSFGQVSVLSELALVGHLELELADHEQFALETRCALGRLKIGARRARLLVVVAQRGIETLVVPAVGKLSLRSVRTDPATIGLLHFQGEGDVAVAGEGHQAVLGGLRRDEPGSTSVAVGLGPRAEVTVAGRFTMAGTVGPGVAMKATWVGIESLLSRGCAIEATQAVVLAADVSPSAEEEVHVRAPLVTARGAATRLRVEGAVDVVVEGALRESHISAQRGISVRRSAGDSHFLLSATEPDRLALLIGAEAPAAGPDDAAATLESRRAELNLVAGLQGGSVRLIGGGLAALGALQHADVETDGDILVTGAVSVAPEGRLRAKALLCGELITTGETHLSDLKVDRSVHVEGVLHVDGSAEVGGDVDGDEGLLTAGTVTVQGGASGVSLGWRTDLRLTAGEDAYDLEVQGRGMLADGNALNLERDARVALRRSLGEMRVQRGARLTGVLHEAASVEKLTVRGEASIECTEPQPNWSVTAAGGALAFRSKSLAGSLATEARLKVCYPDGQLSVSCQISRFRPADLRERDAEGAAHTAASFEAAGTPVKLWLHSPTVLAPPNGSTVHLTGPVHVTLTGAVRKLVAAPAPEVRATPEAVPSLSITDRDTRVSEAVGDLAITGQMLGRIHGPVGGTSYGPQSLRITKLSLGEMDAPGGALIDIDPTCLDYGDLQHVEKIQVIDATPAALRRYAKRATQDSGQAERAELRERAEWMTRFIASTKDRASSGSARAAARWAANRLHHRSLPAGWEKVVRRAHRALGYSNKVWPPLLTWACATAAVVVARVWAWHARHRPRALWQAVQDAVLMPLSIARLGDPVHLFATPAVNTVAFLVTALPLAFLLIAIRNVLREPGERG